MFGRKKKQQQEQAAAPVVKSPCEIFGHIWVDMPWYIEDEYNGPEGNVSKIWITEPYVCHVCHKIKTELLQSEKQSPLSIKAHQEKVAEWKKEYKEYIKPRAVVNDMIHDLIYIDREKLKYWEQLHAPKEETKEERDIGELLTVPTQETH